MSVQVDGRHKNKGRPRVARLTNRELAARLTVLAGFLRKDGSPVVAREALEAARRFRTLGLWKEGV